MLGFSPLGALPIAGLPATGGGGGNYTLTAQHGTYVISGQSATILRSKLLTASSGSYSYTGQSATLLRSKLLSASQGTYAYTGQSATITYTAGSANYTITAQNGTYSIAGQSATLSRSKLLTASAGSYAVTGQSATILRSRLVTATNGTYSISGQSATISRNRYLTATAGAYSVAGQSATITKATPGAYVITALHGTYVVNGQDATLTVEHSSGFADTHDGFWHKKWLKLWESKKPELAEVIEYVEAHPQEALEAVQTVAPEKVSGITVAQIDYSTKIAELLAKQIIFAISKRQLQLQQDEEDAEFLLLMD